MNQAFPPILNFSLMDEEKLRALCAELTLSMSMDTLIASRQYFLLEARRAATAAELRLLDALVRETAESMAYITVTELTTDEDHIAETYADMMERRRILLPNAPLPPAYGELTTIGRRHLDGTLERAEQALMASGRAGRRKVAAMKKAKKAEAAAAEGIDTSARICREPMQAGDTVYAVFRNAETVEFDSTLDRFLASNAVVNYAKEILPVHGKSPLFSLLTLGVAVDFTPYYPASYEDLLRPEDGAILVSGASNAAELLLLAHDMGLRVKRLGRIAEDDLVRLAFDADAEKTFSFAFLQSLLYTASASVQIDRGAPEDTTLQISPTTTFDLGRKHYCITKVAADGSAPFHVALYAAIGGMSAAVARGADPSAFTISASLSAPDNKRDHSALGNSLAAILGLYRAEAEFSLYNSSTVFEDSADKAVTLWTMAPVDAPLPDTAVGGGSMIYYLEPSYLDGGLVDFASLRKMHSYIYALHRDGLILSAHAASGDILKALGKMSLHTEIEYVRGERIIAKLGGILIETRETIDGILVARTEGTAPEKKEEPLP